MDVVVNDTNILIDLYCADLLQYCKLMSLEFHTLSVIIEELLDPNQLEQVTNLISEGTLKVHKLNEFQMTTVYNKAVELSGKKKLSSPDISVMIYAKDNHFRLLTGDSELRSQAEFEGVDVSGVLFIIDKMILDEIVPPHIMADSLEKMIKAKRRLPISIINDRIKRLREERNPNGYRFKR